MLCGIRKHIASQFSPILPSRWFIAFEKILLHNSHLLFLLDGLWHTTTYCFTILTYCSSYKVCGIRQHTASQFSPVVPLRWFVAYEKILLHNSHLLFLLDGLWHTKHIASHLLFLLDGLWHTTTYCLTILTYCSS